MQDLSNNGIYFRGSLPRSKCKRILICGVPRSGTTCVASIFENIGCDVGNTSAVKEDVAYHQIVNTGPEYLLQSLENYRVRRDAENSDKQMPWVLKHPMAYLHIGVISKSWPLADTLIVVVTRDPLAVALRNAKSMLTSREASLLNAIDQYSDMVKVVVNHLDASVLFVSYEKLATGSQDTIRQLLEAAWIEPSPDNMAAALDAVNVDNTAYLNESHTCIAYNLDVHTDNLIQGWIYASDDHSRRIELEIESEYGAIAVPVNKHRQDLAELHRHKTGICGFSLTKDDYAMTLMDRDDCYLWPALSDVRIKMKGIDFYLQKRLDIAAAGV
jgi:hypothetical protein